MEQVTWELGGKVCLDQTSRRQDSRLVSVYHDLLSVPQSLGSVVAILGELRPGFVLRVFLAMWLPLVAYKFVRSTDLLAGIAFTSTSTTAIILEPLQGRSAIV